GRLFACELFRGVQGARYQRQDSRSRTIARVASGVDEVKLCLAPCHTPLSSPRKRGPIRRALSMWCRRREQDRTGIMGPRLRGDDKKTSQSRLIAGTVLIVTTVATTPSPAQPVADFYHGKSIEFLVGGAAGGGYDVASRLIATHMGRHVPGNPGFVVRNV